MLLEFTLASLILIAIPGPDQALIMRNAALCGRRAGMRTMLGGATGLGVHATCAAVGLSALLAASATAFTAVKVVGIAYLLYLGVRLLRTPVAEPAAEASARGRRPYLQGLASNALNPKVALFFVTFLPQFLPGGGDVAGALALSALFAALYLAWFLGLIAVVGLVAETLRRPRVAAWMERMSGAALVGFAVRLSSAAHP